MTQLKSLDDLMKFAFGIDRIVGDIDRRARMSNGYPPFNIISDSAKNPSNYRLEMAVAGFSRDEISVKVEEEDGIQLLTIEGRKQEESPDTNYLYRQIAARDFTRQFTLAPNTVVENVGLKDGMLTINVAVIKPEPTKKEKILQIN